MLIMNNTVGTLTPDERERVEDGVEDGVEVGRWFQITRPVDRLDSSNLCVKSYEM